MTAAISCAVIVVSDRCFRGEETDSSGPVLQEGLEQAGFVCRHPLLLPDSVSTIKESLRAELSRGTRVVLLAGGTGLSPQDVTPEAVAPFIETPLTSLTQLLTSAALAQTPYAALSRSGAGLTGTHPRSLIVTLAGSVNAASTAVATLTPLIAHLFSQVDRSRSPEGPYVEH